MDTKSIAASLTAGNEVLIVEDELRVRDMLTRALKELGFKATLTPTAETALKAIAERSFDIVILDLNLPGMDGIQFLKTIRQRGKNTEVIILTGFGDLEAAKTAIHFDVVDFITKPYALGTLESALDRAQKRIRARLLAEVPADVAALMPPEPDAAPPTFDQPAVAGNALDDLERSQIIAVLNKHRGNRAAAADELGISLRKLYYRLGAYQKKGLLS